jgi:hypothetical protein
MMQLSPTRRVSVPKKAPSFETDPAKWPFLQIVDPAGRDLGWCGFAGPLREPKHRRHYEHLASKYRFIGFCSHGEFPNENWVYPCEAWCHGYRDPERRLPPHVPQVCLSESDFADAEAINQAAISSQSEARVADYVVVALPGWPARVKHPELARECAWELHKRLGLQGLFVGDASPESLPPGTTFETFLPWQTLMASISRARFVLFTSEVDGSPRLITESLSLNRPIVVYDKLMQGFKYVNAHTGEFFSGAHDVAASAARTLTQPREPYAQFHQHHGLQNACRTLGQVLSSLSHRDIPWARIIRR